MFERLGQFLTDFLLFPLRIFEGIFNWLPGYLGTFVAWFRTLLEQTIPEQFAALIPQGWIDFLNQPVVETIMGIVGDVLWFYPFIPILLIYSAAYAAILGIRIARYIVGFIPGVDG